MMRTNVDQQSVYIKTIDTLYIILLGFKKIRVIRFCIALPLIRTQRKCFSEMFHFFSENSYFILIVLVLTTTSNLFEMRADVKTFQIIQY